MERIIVVLLLGLFLVAAFGRDYIPSPTLYWSIYPVMLVLVVAYWFLKYYVGKNAVNRILGKEVDFSLFVGKVSVNVQEDLKRGRLCISDGKVILISRKNVSGYQSEEQFTVSDINSIGFGKVVGIRKGFTFNLNDGQSVSYAKILSMKNRKLLFEALGWQTGGEADV